MDSQFFITSSNQNASLELTEEQFRVLKRARKRLSAFHAITHKFRLVESNFQLIREAMEKLATCYIAHAPFEETESSKARLNACINNYVLSARIFTAQLKRHVQGCLPQERELVNQITEQMEREYKRSFAYRFIDSLYDYVSYYGLSVHSLRLDVTYPDDEPQPKYNFNAYIERDYIGGPADFRASVLNETPNKLNLISLLDEFYVSLSRLHDLALSLTNQVVDHYGGIIKEYANVFTAQHGIEHSNLFVVHLISAASETVYDRFPISMYINNHNLAEEYI